MVLIPTNNFWDFLKFLPETNLHLLFSSSKKICRWIVKANLHSKSFRHPMVVKMLECEAVQVVIERNAVDTNFFQVCFANEMFGKFCDILISCLSKI